MKALSQVTAGAAAPEPGAIIHEEGNVASGLQKRVEEWMGRCMKEGREQTGDLKALKQTANSKTGPAAAVFEFKKAAMTAPGGEVA